MVGGGVSLQAYLSREKANGPIKVEEGDHSSARGVSYVLEDQEAKKKKGEAPVKAIYIIFWHEEGELGNQGGVGLWRSSLGKRQHYFFLGNLPRGGRCVYCMEGVGHLARPQCFEESDVSTICKCTVVVK